ncbi:transcription termination/antitermination NusG family protein [Phocaeicola vulgatus]|uniref:transcription termination/antitermination NusG family protein n=1 Tax=Phocaeicola TaxID=909656 RepID=UPI001E44245E|nr:transcription termination/antitermination NusG family protein [Phocaeicola vulgatus]MDB0814906.1 transcription termination/antitermination NusG family protein [Phocaeicola vulgatus]
MNKKWYALKVFYNRFSEIENTLSHDGIESYIPMKTRNYPQLSGEIITLRNLLF